MYPINGDIFNPGTNIKTQRIFTAQSTALSQDPTGLGPSNAIPVEFGPAQGDSSDRIMMDANGMITVNKEELYRIRITLVFGRVGNPGVSELLFRITANGTQLGITVPQKISSGNVLNVYEFDSITSIPAGAAFVFEIMRDSSGNDSGGLVAGLVTADPGAWNDAPCARIFIDRFYNPDLE